MAFPHEPKRDEIDERGLFAVQTPDLRARILPLYRFDPQLSAERPHGHGTAFRIDPWSRCLTAWHVVEDLLEPGPGDGKSLRLRDDMRLAALQIEQLGYGRLPIPDGSWFPIDAAYSVHAVQQRPLQKPEIRNLMELMVLRIHQPRRGEGTPFLPLDLSSWHPAVGKRVQALGFALLDVARDGEGDERPFRQPLYGSFGRITHVEPADPNRARPWPFFRVDADWPKGMSGGPVMNEAGHVIGVVSAGFEGEGGAAATYFSGWDLPERILGSIDRSNPGHFRCFGVFDKEGQLAFCGQEPDAIRAFGEARGFTDYDMVSVEPYSGDWSRGKDAGRLVRVAFNPDS